MAIVANDSPGVFLTGVFDKSNPGVKDEIKIFAARLASLQQKYGFGDFIYMQEVRENIIKIAIIPSSSTPAGGARANANLEAALLSMVGDGYQGSGAAPAVDKVAGALDSMTNTSQADEFDAL